jgi:predicted permease
MWLRRKRSNEDFSEELLANIAIERDRLVEEGMDPAAALAAARRTFGNVTRAQERFYESNRTMWLDDLWRDVHYALRAMRQRPGFTLMAILTLALGIGANTAIFTLVDAVVLKPLAVPAAGELITFYENGPEGPADPAGGTGRYLRFSYPRFQRLAAALGSHGMLAAATRSNAFVLRQSDAAARTRISGQLVSGGYFQTLRVLAERGRLVDEDDLRKAAPVAVISDAFWRRAMNSSEDAIGQTLVLNGLNVTIIGVAERQFAGMWTDSEADVWLPLTLQQAIGYQNNSSGYGPSSLENNPWPNEDRIAWLNVIGRVRGKELGVATAVLESANRQGVLDLAALLDPRDSMRTHTLVIEPFARGFSGLRARYSEALWILSVLVAMVLLATCSSVANLLLARAAGKARETGVRVALGATAGRLVRQGLAESLLLGLTGGAIGLWSGAWASAFLARQVLGSINNLPQVFSPDARVLIFTAAIALLTVLGFGLAPAVRAMRIGRNTTPGAGLRGGIERSAMKGMRPLVAVQVALAVVIVFAAVLLGRTLMNFTRIDPGFSDRLVVAVFDPTASGYSADQARNLDASLSAAVGVVPGVTSVATSRCGLVAGCSSSGSFKFEGSGTEDSYHRNWISPGYFAAVGIPMIAGREFDERDAGARPVAIISESIARRYFPGQNPIGERMGYKDLDTEIIGVVRDARSITIHDPPASMIYMPLHGKSDIGIRVYSMEARVNGDPSGFVAAVRNAIRRAEPGLVVNDLSTMPTRLGRDTARERVVAYLSLSFAFLTLLLASLGIYGVLAYNVARRTKEIGVRIALGARRSEVTLLILSEALGVTVAGVVVGLGAAAILSRYLQAMLFGVSALSLSSFAIVPALFAILAAASAYVPARRAMNVDPLVALRYE